MVLMASPKNLITLLIITSSCSHNSKNLTNQGAIVSKIYNYSKGIKPPENRKAFIAHTLLDFITTKHLRYVNLEIGAEIILAKNNCHAQSKKYILGKKLEDDWQIFADPSENYRYKPEYDLIFLSPGKYKLCALHHYIFTEYNQENEFEEYFLNGPIITLKAGETIYLGDIVINKDNYETILNILRVQKYLNNLNPALLNKFKVNKL